MPKKTQDLRELLGLMNIMSSLPRNRNGWKRLCRPSRIGVLLISSPMEEAQGFKVLLDLEEPKDKDEAKRPQFKACKFTTKAIIADGEGKGEILHNCMEDGD